MADALRYCRPEAVGVHPSWVENYSKELKKLGKMQHSFLMLRHGQVFAEGYHKPFHKDQFHRMYSVSKTMTAIAIGMLMEEGKLGLGDRITDYFPDLLPEQVSRADAIYNISHGAMVLKALELGDEKLLRNAMQDRLHQNYRKSLIADYEKIEGLVRTTGAAFCLSGAGPTLLCITLDEDLEEKLAKKLDSVTTAKWQMIPLHIEFEGARVIESE